MSIHINFSSKNLVRNFSALVETISESLVGQFSNDDAIINPEAQVFLNNPKDKTIVDSAVQELKKNKNLKTKTVTLSNREKVTLSVN